MEKIIELDRHSISSRDIEIGLNEFDKYIKKQAFRLKNIYGHSVPLEDLIQSGRLGFIKGYIRTRNNRQLNSYFYIKRTINIEIFNTIATTGFVLTYRGYMFKELKLYSKYKEDLLKADALEEEGEEYIYKNYGLNKKKLANYEKIVDCMLYSNGIELEQAEYRQVNLEDYGLEETIERKVTLEQVYSLLDAYPAREKTIIYHRFGLKNYKKMTLNELGSYYNISKERVRQIESKVLEEIGGHNSIKN